jgi:MFS family permease
MSTFLPTFLVETAHFSIKTASLYFMAMYLIEVFARPLMGAYSDKIGKRKRIIIVECSLCALFFLALTIVHADLILLLIIVGIGFLAGSIPVLSQTYVIEMIPEEQRERTLGFLFTVCCRLFRINSILRDSDGYGRGLLDFSNF